MDERTKRARLVAKILRGGPYFIENREEFEHFFGGSHASMPFEEALKHFALAENRIFIARPCDIKPRDDA